MSSFRQKIEDAIEKVISDCLLKSRNPRSGYLALVDFYNDQTDQTDGPNAFLRKVRGRAPFVLISGVSSPYSSESISRTRFKRVLSIDFYVGSNHMRDRESRNRADAIRANDPTADPGIYLMQEDLEQLLAGNDLGIDCMGPLMPQREDILLQEDPLTVWRLNYEASTDAHVKKRDHGDQALTATLVRSHDADNDDSAFPDYNPVVEAEQDHT